LYRSVSDTKVALSGADEAELFFSAEGIEIRETVTRRDFEGWIAPELAKIGQALDEVFERSGVGPEAVDQVFMTGGSSFVPAVRR
ncbi:Hsp70 family protein, partial [Acinetobacter baumannii]